MQKLCENCKFWVATNSMQNWGTCTKNGSDTQGTKNRAVTGILRRCDENCVDFKATRKTGRVRR